MLHLTSFSSWYQSMLAITGYVADLNQYFDQARVFIAPLRFGAGMKGKIGMAMSLGLPIVTTTIGAEGMGLVDGVHALVADDPKNFADAIKLLQSDDRLWNELSSQARGLATDQWSPTRMRDRLTDLVAMAVPAGRFAMRTWGTLESLGDFDGAMARSRGDRSSVHAPSPHPES